MLVSRAAVLRAVTVLLLLNLGISFPKKCCHVVRSIQKNHIIMSSSRDAMDLNGFANYIRSNPFTDKFSSRSVHHVEFYTGEATSVSKRFAASLGMELSAFSDLSSGNEAHASYVIQSNRVRIMFTSPYSVTWKGTTENKEHHHIWQPGFNAHEATSFISMHGLGVRAVAIEVDDVSAAYNTIVANGGKSHLPPIRLHDQTHQRGFSDVAEVKLYGDTLLRLINVDSFTGKFSPNFVDCCECHAIGRFGLNRIDHIVGNVFNLNNVVNYLKGMTGFHEFAEFTTEDVGTVDSGLNSVVLANNNEMILLPINEPTYGTKRKSQIQTYLEQYQGEGVQHIALLTDDIFSTLRQMKVVANMGIGFTFMKPPPIGYYERLRDRLGTIFPLTEEQFTQAKELGVLIDRDDQGMLLQVFTTPIGDRPTLFFEIIQRIGCQDTVNSPPKPGCGGFGKGNFRDLFKSIEDFEISLGINSIIEK